MSRTAYRFSTLQEVADLVWEFEAGTLPRSQWTHPAHLAVGAWYLLHGNSEEARASMRQGIQNYNRAWGIESTRDSGYHETITMFWMGAIEKYLTETIGEDYSLLEKINGAILCYADRQLPLNYYSLE